MENLADDALSVQLPNYAAQFPQLPRYVPGIVHPTVYGKVEGASTEALRI